MVILLQIRKDEQKEKKNTSENEPQLATSVFNRSGSVSAARFVMIVAANHAKRKRHLNSISFTILNHQHPSYLRIGDISSSNILSTVQSFIPPGKPFGKSRLFLFFSLFCSTKYLEVKKKKRKILILNPDFGPLN